MGKLFGTDGIRGIANVELTPELAFQVGRAGALVLAGHCPDKRKILVGRDTRISGTMLESALAAGICSAGYDVVLAGVLPTPAVAYLVRTSSVMVAGVVISASHNPMAYNGIKFFGANGYKLPDAIEDEIEAIMMDRTYQTNAIKERQASPVQGDGIGVISHEEQYAWNYACYLKESLGTDLTGLKIVVDCANGAASIIAPRVLADLGAIVQTIHDRPNGININEKCGSTHLESLCSSVKEVKADLGLAFDGDADRLLAVDEKGNPVDGDQIMGLCALALAQKGQLEHNQIVVTVMSNMGLHLAMRNAGISVIESQVGDRYVLEKMLETGAVLGGEQSGHIIFSKTNTTGDGLATALHLVQILKESGKPLSQLVIQRLPQYLQNVPVKNKAWQDNMPVTAAVAKAKAQLVERGRVLVRPSGTEPLLRVMAEGSDQHELETLVTEISTVITSELN